MTGKGPLGALGEHLGDPISKPLTAHRVHEQLCRGHTTYRRLCMPLHKRRRCSPLQHVSVASGALPWRSMRVVRAFMTTVLAC